ncbi:DUF397 domain-containing protein [Actinomadura flavalba]|uniref:DUF397 domain-containing protein n=1 Tax=Actinomadura flavalba TaxID=1120938 RepID=UPI000374A1FA|nr:DUF397 domain-containing protein [Actinomadura flavalba]
MIEWRKSSRSQQGGQGNCVELSTNVTEAVHIRDSKNPTGPHLALTRPHLADLLTNVKSGTLNL